MADRRKAFSLISRQDHCQRSSSLQISDTPWAGFEPAQNLISRLVEWSCVAVIPTTPLVHFHPTTQKSKNFTSMSYFCPKYLRFELQKYRRVIFHDTEQWCKIWINPDLVVSKMTWRIGWTFIRALKSLKNCTLMSSFCKKHIFFQLKKFIGIMCRDTEGWCEI